MAKTKISEFSATPGNNTDIDSINISEGCAPSGINDAIRELMAQLKDFQAGTAGDSFNGPIGTTTAAAGAFTTLTTSSTVTHNGGTANGVAYLNGSKVLTTGSALTFDGTTLGTNRFSMTGFLATFNNDNFYMEFQRSGTPFGYIGTGSNTAGGAVTDLGIRAQNNLVFAANAAEQMRLTSTGLGIGTSSPREKLDVAGNIAAPFQDNQTIQFQYLTGSSYGLGMMSDATNRGLKLFTRSADGTGYISFSTGGMTEKMRLDYSGNLGIGTSSPQQKLEVSGSSQAGVIYERISNSYGALGSIGSGTGLQFFGWDAGVTAVISSLREASSYSPSYLSFQTFGGNSDTGSNTLAERMRIDGRGNLGLGVTPSAWQSSVKAIQNGAGALYTINTVQQRLSLNAYRDSAGTMRYINSSINANEFRMGEGDGSFQWHTAPSGTAGNAISFTQAMTLDASGRLGVGETSPTSRIHANGTIQAITGATGVQIYGDGGSGYVNSVGANPLIFQVNSTERARIDSSGNLLVGTTSAGGYRLRVEGGPTLVKYGDSALWTSEIWNPGTTGDNKFMLFYTESSATTRGSITYNRAGGLTAYNTTSDYRAKDITGPVADSGALIDSVPVYMGKMKGATQERPMFIAHETPAYAHTGVKDAVDADGNPVYQQMDASALIPVMWAEIQSLRARLAAANI